MTKEEYHGLEIAYLDAWKEWDAEAKTDKEMSLVGHKYTAKQKRIRKRLEVIADLLNEYETK